MSETRFLIDFRQTTDLKNATRYEQKIKKRKKRKKTVKIASSKKKEGKYASQRRQPRRPQKMSSARKKKRSTTSMSMMPAATQQRRRSEQRWCACVFAVCYQQVALWGGRAACVNGDDDGDCDVDVANLDLDLETHWRFWGELGAFYGCVLLLFLFSACFSSLFFSFFLHVSWHEVLKSKACIVWVVARSVCVCGCLLSDLVLCMYGVCLGEESGTGEWGKGREGS